MLCALACCLALAQQQDEATRDTQLGIQPPTMLVVYVARKVLLNNVPDNVSNVGSNTQYDRVGLVNWSCADGGVGGVPCKIYKGDGKWMYKNSIRNTAMYDYHEATYTMEFDIGLDGIPIHTVSHFDDESEKTSRIVDVSADYKSDHIDVTRDVGNGVEHFQVFPTFGMERFAGMFQPLIRSGVVQEPERDCAVIHPYTGMPYEFKVKVRGRFTGYYFGLPQAGYCLDVLGDQGDCTSFVTRQGQLIKMDLFHNVDAVLELGPTGEERQGWGQFKITDWNKSTDDTNPERPKFNTLAIPVLFKDPHLLFPVPCVVAE